MHTPSTSGISAQRLSNGLQVNYSRKRAAASQGHGYCVLTTTQLTPTWYCCIDHCVHHGNILHSPQQYIHVYGHHGNIHVCALCVTISTYTCTTFYVTMATYRCALSVSTLCSPQQYMYAALSLSPWQQCNKIQAGH